MERGKVLKTGSRGNWAPWRNNFRFVSFLYSQMNLYQVLSQRPCSKLLLTNPNFLPWVGQVAFIFTGSYTNYWHPCCRENRTPVFLGSKSEVGNAKNRYVKHFIANFVLEEVVDNLWLTLCREVSESFFRINFWSFVQSFGPGLECRFSFAVEYRLMPFKWVDLKAK